MAVVSVPSGSPRPAGSGGRVLGPYPSRAAAEAAGAQTAGPAPAGQWWCIRPPAPGVPEVRVIAAGMTPEMAPGSQALGPYLTQAEAQAACAGAPAAPPPTLPSATPPVYTPPGQTWSCWRQPDGGVFIALTTATPAVPGTVITSGPYATYEEAHAVCGATAVPLTDPQLPPPYVPFPMPAEPPPAVPPPAVPPPAQPPPDQPPPYVPPPPALPAPTPLPVEGCTLPAAFAGGIPLPGTVEFCAVQDQVLAWFQAAGDAVWQWVLDATDPAAINAALGQLQQQSTGILSSAFTAIMVPIAQWIVSLSSPIMQRVHDAILCLRQLVGASMRCNVQLLLSLLGLKTVISFTKELNFGTLGGTFVVAQDTFDLALGQFEKVLDYLIAYVCPAEIPGREEAAEAFLRGLISREYYECLMRLHGMAPETFEPFLMARSERLNPREAIQWVRRQGGTPEEEDDVLLRAGFYDGSQAAKFRELYDELPTIGDHLEWMRKNVFDDEYVRDFKLMDGFEERFWAKFGGDLRALGMKKENAALHYAAHWLNPSFSQLFEMTQRLRSGRVDPSLQFTRDDLLRVMQEQDVGIYFRQRLEAVSHPTINLTLCIKLFANGAFTPDEFHERLKDLGFDDTSAEYIRRGLTIEVSRLRASSGRGWNPSAIAKAVGLGLMTDDEATKRMAQIGYTADEAGDMIGRAVTERTASAMSRSIGRTITKQAAAVTGSYAMGITDHDAALASLRTIGYPEDVAQNALLTVDIQAKMALVKAGQACVKKALSKGKITNEQALEQLKGIGVGEERAQELVQLLGIQCAAAPPQATAAQILRWVAQGLLPAARARERLINLGWGDPDLMLQLSAAQASLAGREARAEALVSRSAQGQARELEKLSRQSQQQQERLRQSIRRVTPPAKLTQWFAADLIGESYFLQRLEAMGIVGTEANEYLAEAQRRRTEARARTARAGS